MIASSHQPAQCEDEAPARTSTGIGATEDELRARTDAAVAVARRSAEITDREARFPKDAFDELRAQRLLGLLLPQEYGGEAASIPDIAQICYSLGRACSSSSMIFAMHQASIACLLRH